MVPRVRPLIAIGYKYNTQKVLSFIVTETTASTQSGLTYLSNYPDHFSYVAIHPVSCLLVMYKLFGSVHKVNSHNKSRQSDLATKKFWVTQCGWIW